MPKCPWCNRRVWLWQSNLYNGPCARCWRIDSLALEFTTQASNGSLSDPRLEGTWQSDAIRTLAGWQKHRYMSQDQVSKFNQLFGHLRVTYAGQHVAYDFSRSPLPGMDKASYSTRFAVVARDAKSVVILATDHEGEVPELQHLRFPEPDVYSIQTSMSPIVEYFTRV